MSSGGSCLLVAALIGVVGCAAPKPGPAPPAVGSGSAIFSPATVQLTSGQSTTVTIRAEGLNAGSMAVQFGLVHSNSVTEISNPQCMGIFAGADASHATQPTGDLLACTYATGGATGTSGDVMTVTLTNRGGGAETISFNPALTIYLTSTLAAESLAATSTLTVSNEPAS
jgi:hypothetical protein